LNVLRYCFHFTVYIRRYILFVLDFLLYPFRLFRITPLSKDTFADFTVSFLRALLIHDLGLHFNLYTLHTAAMLHLAMAFDFQEQPQQRLWSLHVTNMVMCWSVVDSVSVLGGTSTMRRHVGV
jgi:hypothetical protein